MQNKKRVEERLRKHFRAAPHPDSSAVEDAVQAVKVKIAEGELRRASGGPETSSGRQGGASRRRLFAPCIVSLAASQLRATKGLVWITQALVVTAVLIVASNSTNLALMLGAFGAAGAVLAGISTAGIIFDQNTSFAEISYSFHYDYRQIVLVRMMIYGLGDLAGLLLLSLLGSSLAPLGLAPMSPAFTEVFLCSGATFFVSGLACFATITRYRKDSSTILCVVLSLLIAAANQVIWSEYSLLLSAAPPLFWPLFIAAVAAGLAVCVRSLFRSINAGYQSLPTLRS